MRAVRTESFTGVRRPEACRGAKTSWGCWEGTCHDHSNRRHPAEPQKSCLSDYARATTVRRSLGGLQRVCVTLP
jgi:hypothetical protein